MRSRIISAGVLLCAFACPAALSADGAFAERDGLVVMEAESASVIRGWDELDGTSGRALRDAGGHLEFTVAFERTGRYYAYILARCTSTEDNDAYFTLDGERLYASDGRTRPEGMRCHSKAFAWSFLPKGPGGHTPPAIKMDPVYFLVAQPGTKVLRIGSRSKGFTLDKIVLKLDGKKAKPEGAGPDETPYGPAMPKIDALPRVTALVGADRLGAALIEARRHVASSDEQTARQARSAAEALVAHATAAAARAAALKRDDPVAATRVMSELARRYAGTPEGRGYSRDARVWRSEPATVEALKAESIWAQVARDARGLKAGAATDARSGRDPALARLEYVARFLAKRYPDTPACRRALARAKEVGLAIPTR